MKKCAFLTMDNMEGFISDDELAVKPLAALGWGVEFLSWRQTEVSWSEFDAVIIRTTWDYQNKSEAYLSILEAISQVTHLENDISLVHWNMHKSYLRDLERRGIGIVPTLWGRKLTSRHLPGLFASLNSQEMVIKPVISANADDTYLLSRALGSGQVDQAVAAFTNRPFMAQPFMPGIVEEGEYSLFFFAGEYSHAILKSPKVDDFRVQEEHGGLIQTVKAEPLLVHRAKTAIDVIYPLPLYARVDMVRSELNDFVVMELELIEPSLYLRMDPGAPARFATAVDSWIRNKQE